MVVRPIMPLVRWDILARWRERVRRAVGRARRRDFVLLGVALAACGLAALAMRAARIRVQHTGSLPRGIYREVPDARPTTGAIGVWCLPLETARWARERGYIGRGDCPGQTEAIGKVILASAGDTVGFSIYGVTLNGVPVPHSKPFDRDSRGRIVRHAPYRSYVLGDGEVWLWSPYAARSFDSRYFGPARIEQLCAVVRPLWTVTPSR
jgi:conjugative transfer signal peptidase TraF